MSATGDVYAVANEGISATGGEKNSKVLVDEQQRLKRPDNLFHQKTIRCLDEERCLFNDDADPMFDRFTALAKRLFNVPLALVTIIDNDYFWIKSKAGVCGLKEVSRGAAFCSHTILDDAPEVLLIEDALMDVRFQNNPLVTGPPYARFYAGNYQ